MPSEWVSYLIYSVWILYVWFSFFPKWNVWVIFSLLSRKVFSLTRSSTLCLVPLRVYVSCTLTRFVCPISWNFVFPLSLLFEYVKSLRWLVFIWFWFSLVFSCWQQSWQQQWRKPGGKQWQDSWISHRSWVRTQFHNYTQQFARILFWQFRLNWQLVFLFKIFPCNEFSVIWLVSLFRTCG